MTKSPAMQALEDRVSDVIGVKVEITIRSEQRFTISTETPCADLERKVMDFFAPHATLEQETQHDDECGSFVYIAV